MENPELVPSDEKRPVSICLELSDSGMVHFTVSQEPEEEGEPSMVVDMMFEPVQFNRLTQEFLNLILTDRYQRMLRTELELGGFSSLQ